MQFVGSIKMRENIHLALGAEIFLGAWRGLGLRLPGFSACIIHKIRT